MKGVRTTKTSRVTVTVVTVDRDTVRVARTGRSASSGIVFCRDVRMSTRRRSVLIELLREKGAVRADTVDMVGVGNITVTAAAGAMMAFTVTVEAKAEIEMTRGAAAPTAGAAVAVTVGIATRVATLVVATVARMGMAAAAAGRTAWIRAVAEPERILGVGATREALRRGSRLTLAASGAGTKATEVVASGKRGKRRERERCKLRIYEPADKALSII